jgi:hypothetical protein
MNEKSMVFFIKIFLMAFKVLLVKKELCVSGLRLEIKTS